MRGFSSDGPVAGVFTGNRIVRSWATSAGYCSYGSRLAAGGDNLVSGNSIVARGATSDTGIQRHRRLLRQPHPFAGADRHARCVAGQPSTIASATRG